MGLTALAMTFHKALFDGILQNSGEFRKVTDKDQGRIGFGGEDYRHPGNLRFTGSAPHEIDRQLLEPRSDI